MNQDASKNVFKKGADWCLSPAGITIILAVAVALYAAADKGAYVLVNTAVTGGMWALMAIGLALIFGVTNISNFAHGEFFMVGTLVAFFVYTPINNYLSVHPNQFLFAIAPLLAISASFLTGAVLGIISEKVLFSQLRKRSSDEWLIFCFLLTLGISIVMVNFHQLLFGVNYKGIVSYWDLPALSIFDVYISVDRLFASVLALLVIGGFFLFLKYTKIGRAIRAVASDEIGARIVGISSKSIYVITLGLSCGMASLAGASLLFMYPSYPTVGIVPLYNSWFVIIIVGFYNIAGAVVGGFLIALIQILTRVYVGEGWDQVIPVLMIAAVLVFKPTGLFGAKVAGIWEK